MIILHIFMVLLLLKHPDQILNLLLITVIILYISSKKNKPHTHKEYTPENYYQSTYYLSTHINYNNLINDPGRQGEYQIFKSLQFYENVGGKFLFNCYLYKNSKMTTELDVILINHYGVFVFESKNYRGWIFGSEYDTYWIQSLRPQKNSRKYSFYNPILQNETHLRALRNILDDFIPIYSIIVFSNRCVLKVKNIQHTETKVINLNSINQCINQIIMNNEKVLTSEQIIQLYNRLYPYTQVSNKVKQQHINNIKKNR